MSQYTYVSQLSGFPVHWGVKPPEVLPASMAKLGIPSRVNSPAE
jgi:hypothetical protein